MQPNGLPNAADAVVQDAPDIFKFMKKYKKASVIIGVMTQPIYDKVPPLHVLATTGSPLNKYIKENHSIENALKRSGSWQILKEMTLTLWGTY